MELRIPLDQATNRDEVEIIKNRKKQRLAQTQEGLGNAGDGPSSGVAVAVGVAPAEDEEDDKLIVPVSACLSTFFVDETIEYRNPSLGNLHTLYLASPPTHIQVLPTHYPAHLLTCLYPQLPLLIHI